MIRFVKDFLSLEASSGIILMLVAVLAMLVANSPWEAQYFAVWNHVLGGMTVSLWINDGLMAVFFLLIGLEIKREMKEGELSTRSKALFPCIAALGGVVAPALIYGWFNWGGQGMRGWAIPSATDIAFSLGVLSLFGNRIPLSLKIFLMALAVIDDLAAVMIIAVFYTEHLSLAALAGAAFCALILYEMNRKNNRQLWLYLGVGFVMWAAMLKSGVHPTIAGVALGLLIPADSTPTRASLSKRLEHALHPWVAFGIMPLFAFANAGVRLGGVTVETILHPVTLGIAAGLFLGKQVGVAFAAWLMVRFLGARLPENTSWTAFYGVCLLAGIGFTMSLFIGTLAFGNNEILAFHTRLGVVSGSLVSALSGAALLVLVGRRPN